MKPKPSVLIAAPTAKVKDYALKAYLDGIDALKYPNKTLMLVDTTDDYGDYKLHLWDEAAGRKFGLILAHVAPDTDGGGLYGTIDRAWEMIFEYTKNYTYVLSLESDTVIAPDGLSIMVKTAEQFGAAAVRHAYMHRSVSGYAPNLGIMMIRSDIIEKIGDRKDDNGVYVHEARRFMIESLESQRPVIDLYNVFETQHHLETGVIEKKIVWGHGIKLQGIPAES